MKVEAHLQMRSRGLWRFSFVNKRSIGNSWPKICLSTNLTGSVPAVSHPKKTEIFLRSLSGCLALRGEFGFSAAELEENHARDPRWTWARNQMANCRLINNRTPVHFGCKRGMRTGKPTAAIDMTQAAPAITRANRAGIAYGASLSSKQLNAKQPVKKGSFTVYLIEQF